MKTILSILLISVLTACSNAPINTDENTQTSTTSTNTKFVLADDVNWSPLNPARGDKSPQAGALWGDRTGSEAAGFLVKFNEGFSSPPHIHNISYRGLVISGLLHNDDPQAANMWLPTGSYWTQPAGEVHITSANASNNLAYIEIEQGPYLVLPTEEAFDNGERPINVEQSNMVWLDAANIVWIDPSDKANNQLGPKVAFLWGSPEDNQYNGTLIKLPAGFTGTIKTQGSIFHAVVIKGQTQYQNTADGNVKTLDPSSYFGSTEASIHSLSNNTEKESIIYIRTNGKYEIASS